MIQKKKILKSGLEFENSNLAIVSGFDIRISDLFSGVSSVPLWLQFIPHSELRIGQTIPSSSGPPNLPRTAEAAATAGLAR
jgi:hypothetical protein